MDDLFDGSWDDEEEEFRYYECYEFNRSLDEILDDERCIHCAKYLTLQCEHLELFKDQIGM